MQTIHSNGSSRGEILMKNRGNKLKMIIEDNNNSGAFSKYLWIYRIFLSIPVTNCESKYSFSVLPLIKNKYCSMVSESRLTLQSILSKDYDLISNMSFKEIIRQFAEAKSRKNFFKRSLD